MKKLILLLILPLLLASCVKKELLYEVKGEVNGIVVDENEVPIEGAIVTLVDRGALTNEKGFFMIDNLEVGGNPKYQVYIEKDGYTSQVVEADFETTINVEGTDDVDDDIPLNHAVVSIKVKMGTLLSLRGRLNLPANITLKSNDSIAIETNFTINENYDSTVNLDNIQSEIDSNLNFSIKNIPRIGTFEGSSSIEKVLSKITINLYMNGAEKPSYTTSIEDIDLTRYSVTSSNGENIVDLENLELEKLYKISGYVYKNASELAVDGEKLSSAIVVLSKGSEEAARTLTDSTGKYSFEGIESGSGYQLKLLSLDSDNNGNYDYMEKDDFSTFSIVSSQTNDKTFDLWYDKGGNYSVSGVVYAGNKEDVPVAGAKVVLSSDDGLKIETISNSLGEYTFNNVTRKTVYITAEDLDSDGNGIINFEGYESSDASSLKTKVTIMNTNFIDIANKKLYMKINDEEPNYNINLIGSNFFSVNSSGSVYNQSSIEVSDSIILTFDKDLTQSVIDSIEARNVDIVTFTNISTGNTVDISVSLDPADNSKLIIDPANILDMGTYRLQVSTELNVELGFNYGIKNTINSQILSILTITIEN